MNSTVTNYGPGTIRVKTDRTRIVDVMPGDQFTGWVTSIWQGRRMARYTVEPGRNAEAVTMTERDAQIAELRNLMFHGEIVVRDYDMRSADGRKNAALWILARLEIAADGEIVTEKDRSR